MLSAAHCWGAETVFVSLGIYKIILEQNETAEFYSTEHIPIAESIKHPYYNNKTYDYDFWLIKLQWASSLYLDNTVVVDDDPSPLNPDDPLYVMGFGKLIEGEGGNSSNVMQKVYVDYMTNQCCQEKHSKTITDQMMCASKDGKDACQVSNSSPKPIF